MAQDAAVEVQERVGLDGVMEGLPDFTPDSAEVGSSPGDTARRKPILKVAAPVAVLALIVAAANLYHSYAGWESTDDAQTDGYVNPISSRVGGYVAHVDADDNQYVKAGTVLVQIDPKDYQVALDGAEATLANDEATATASLVNIPVTEANTTSQIASAEADVIHAHAGVAASEKQLAAAQAALVEAEANQAKAFDDVSRFKKLVDKQEIAEQQYTQAVETANGASAAVEAARASVQMAQDQVTQARSRVSKAQAALEAAQTGPSEVRIQRSKAQAFAAMVAKSRSALEQAKLNLGYTEIVAPVDGVVAKRSAQVGEYVSPGQQLLAIIPLDDIWVTANFKETQLKKMRPGLPVKIYVDAFDRDYTGRVESIAGGTGSVFSLLPPENATGNYVKVVQRLPVRIRFDSGQDPDHRLRPGMSVEPEVKVD